MTTATMVIRALGISLVFAHGITEAVTISDQIRLTIPELAGGIREQVTITGAFPVLPNAAAFLVEPSNGLSDVLTTSNTANSLTVCSNGEGSSSAARCDVPTGIPNIPNIAETGGALDLTGRLRAADGTLLTLPFQLLVQSGDGPSEVVTVGFNESGFEGPISFTFNVAPGGAAAKGVVLREPDGITVSDIIVLNGNTLTFCSDPNLVPCASSLPAGARRINERGAIFLDLSPDLGLNPGFKVEVLSPSVPEPPTILLLGVGALSLSLYGRRRRRLDCSRRVTLRQPAPG
jgi:hypothetical protein